MTQIPQSISMPNPSDGDAASSSASAASVTGTVDQPAAELTQTELELTELKYYSATASKRLRSRMQAASPQSKVVTTSSGQRFGKRWADLSLRKKLAALLLLSAAVPTIVVTQSLISINQSGRIQDTEELTQQRSGLFRDTVLWDNQDKAETSSAGLAQLVQASGIDPSDLTGQPPEELGKKRAMLQKFMTLAPLKAKGQDMSFQILVDIKGRNVAQDIRLLNPNQPIPKNLAQAQATLQAIPVKPPLNQDLRRFPLVQKVLSSGIAAGGVESLSPELSQALKLDGQLELSGQSVSQQGQVLTAFSIAPVLLNGRTRGAVITGQIINNNSIAADAFKLRYGLSSLSVFDGDQLVLSTQAGNNGDLRQTEAQPGSEVLTAVLEKGEDYLAVERRNGEVELHVYSPIYAQDDGGAVGQASTQEQVEQPQGKPIGMIHATQLMLKSESRFREQQLLAYGLGGGMMLLATLMALPAAASLARPLERLSYFLERLGQGDRNLRITDADRKDEVGQLSANVNHMALSLETNERRLQQALWRNEVLTQIANLRSLDSNDLTEGLEAALEKVRQHLKVDRLVVYRCGTIAKSGRSMFEAQLPGLPSAVALDVRDTCIPQEVLDFYLAGNFKSNPDVRAAGFGPEHMELLESLQVKASLIIPVYGDDKLYGLMVAHSCKKIREWNTQEVELMQLIAGQTASTLAYVTLVEKQREAEVLSRRDKEVLQRRALELLQEVDPVSQGDLTVRARVTPDEIGTVADSYNATVESLRKIVSQVKDVSTQVTSTAQTNDRSVQKLAQDALNQSDQMTSSLVTLETMTSSVQKLAAQAIEAQLIVSTTEETVTAGEQAMSRTVEGMAAIRETVSETTQKMEGLEAASQRISNVIRLISGFAAQTHMLAMKASIEAARAGEDGEGFAVIADEVRSLAAQSAQATADVETVINTIQMATQDVISAMEVETTLVAKQMELVEDTRASLTQITAASTEVNELVVAIAATTEFQTQASTATADTIAEVAQLVRLTSNEATEVSESFKQLLDVSQALQAEVAQFKVG